MFPVPQSRLVRAALAGTLLFAGAAAGHGAERAREGLVALYDFAAASGDLVEDRSGAGAPLNLRVGDSKAVNRSAGALEVRRATLIRSVQPATKISEAVRRSGEITVEAWVRPARLDQRGPARIVSLSANPNERNFTLGQDGNRFEFRLRTERTSANGMPALAAPPRAVTAEMTQVVYTRDRGGVAQIYVNGRSISRGSVKGGMAGWNPGYHLALANELSGDRPWLGTYHLVAIYARALPPNEVERNFQAGAAASTPEQIAAAKAARNARLFEMEIAPLLVRHCFECHDTPTAKGKLDLSRKSAAFAPREDGRTIVPGKPADSLIWETVASGDMPKKRAPLSAREKQLLREWIEGGAEWPVEVVDAATFQSDRRADGDFVRRLTVPEYIATVRDAAGVDIAVEALKLLPPDLRADGFENTAYNLNVDLKHVEAYAKLAEIIVSRMDVEAFARRFSRSQLLEDKENRDLIAKMGKWLLRGPLEEHEIVVYRGITTTVASAGGRFREATGHVLEAMLQSPRFIYRMERQRGSWASSTLSSHELASRVSYALWGAPPDAELIRAAEAGELGDTAKLSAQARRMLADSRAIEHSRRFISQWLDLNRLNHLRPGAAKFPGWSAALAADMREETLAYFTEVVWKLNRPLSELLNHRVTFATPRLARHYGLPPQGEGLARHELAADSARGGLLTQGSVLTMGGDEASMVTRGLFVLKDLLRGVVKDPPPCVDTRPIPTRAGLTQRAIAEQRIASASCGGCHAKFEPLAFGLEKYDGIGAFHERDEHGNRLRDDGSILIPGATEPLAYRNATELMNLLAGSDRVRECLTWKVAQFALGRPLTAADRSALDKIHRQSQDHGGTYQSLMAAIVGSDLIRTNPTETRE